MTKLPEVPDALPSRPADSVQPNGHEYLVTINGSVFVALTLAEAEAILNRRRRRRDGVVGSGATAPLERRVTTRTGRRAK